MTRAVGTTHVATPVATTRTRRHRIPSCVQCGTRQNPCHVKVIGPTLGFVAFAIAAAVEWPVGAIMYPFRRIKGRRMIGHPMRVVYPRVSSAIPF
ncbi:hypothetical protein SELMODRAFT_147726 [Selaginella moellendorffii]|uniref:Uncharacterized protein n=1 Tax=Selaginella moellendorffii TaxID=88036 RepID=D8RJW2_SELML|nr:uncharacterized protein LOC9642772 [Selaginella moellendorffii]EFJ27342.1 hypothetical protein SELMODRAFT_147726 [Selaginella moellendorffii]|eukprot:XP_002971593.1 uncharacterized protein LOC9642772 [Selaginella moellendorffii]